MPAPEPKAPAGAGLGAGGSGMGESPIDEAPVLMMLVTFFTCGGATVPASEVACSTTWDSCLSSMMVIIAATSSEYSAGEESGPMAMP